MRRKQAEEQDEVKQEERHVDFNDEPEVKVIDDDYLEDPLESEQNEQDEQDLDRSRINEEEKIFKHTAKVLCHNSKPETKKIFETLTSNYNRNKTITENLNDMSSQIKKMIAETVKQVKKNEKVIEKVKEEVVKEQPSVVAIPAEEVKEEIKYKSNLSSLMKLR